MPLINFEINLILIRSKKYMLSNDTKATTFAITDTKIYVLAVILSTQDNAKPLQKLKSVIKSIDTSAKPIFRLIIWSNFSGSK